MALKDLDELLSPTFDVTISGKVYRIPEVSALDGLRLNRMNQVAVAVAAGSEPSEEQVKSLELDDGEEREFYELLLGSVYQEMLDDGVSWNRLKHAGQTAFYWNVYGRAIAEEYWEHPEGKAQPAKQPADRKPKSR